MVHGDLSEFLDDLQARALIARVAEPVNPDLEIAAVTDRACKAPRGGPALLFERPTGFEMPVATNVFGSTERICLALGVSALDELSRDIEKLISLSVPRGALGALKMLPLVGRLADLMPR